MEVDPKRTGVKAFNLHSEDWEFINDKWRGPPGGMTRIDGDDEGHAGHSIACPGCGIIGAACPGAKWTTDWGVPNDVTTLTMNPSLAKSCCGWHGYLRNGVFESC